MRLIIFLFLISILFSCEAEEEIPENLISKDSMVNILIDVHIAEGKTTQSGLPRDSALAYYRFLEDEIFEKYDIDSARYNMSMHYYTEQIDVLDEIYEVVLDSLNLKSAAAGNAVSR